MSAKMSAILWLCGEGKLSDELSLAVQVLGVIALAVLIGVQG